MRPQLDHEHIAPEALRAMESFHTNVIAELRSSIEKDAVVVVGMAQNPHVRKVRHALRDASIDFTYLEYGSYVSQWRKRLAIKLWTGWPTFPQVFVKGTLLGGAAATIAAVQDGSLKGRLA